MQYAVIHTATGAIENIIEWDGVSPWEPPAGCNVVASQSYAIGGTLVDGVYTPPPQPESEPEGEEYE